MSWSVQFLDSQVEAALFALPHDIRASFERIVRLIQSHGLERMREPYVKHLEGPVWEMRMKGRGGVARAVTSPRRAAEWWSFTFSRRKRKRRRGGKLI
jgi:hypothetical protein